MRYQHIALSVLMIFFLTMTAYSQKGNQQTEYYDQQASALLPGATMVLEGLNTPFPAWVKFAENEKIPFSDFFNWFNKTLNPDPNIGFKLLKQKSDDLGFRHYLYAETYKGIPVSQATYHLQVNNGYVVSFNGEMYNIQGKSAKKTLSESEALEYALNYVGAAHYMWQNPFWESEIKRKTNNPDATYYPKGKLYWGRVDVSKNQQPSFVLVYSFDVYAEGGSGSQRVLVDANSGTIVNSFPLESDCSSASITEIYNGTSQTIYTDNYMGSTYRLRDDCQSAAIWIRDWGSTTLTASPVEIENTTNTWNGNNNERFGSTVLWHVKQAYLFYLNVYGRNSYDNSNGDVTGYINAVFDCSPPSGCTYTDNASMSFTGGNLKVGFGSGGTLGDTWGALDILGHEYTHAVTGSTSALTYSNESGALNESFSDIFGEAVERYTTGSNDWLVGNDRTSGAIRSMQNPNLYGDPDTYLGTNWYTGTGDNGGVHTNSGVQNYWFYLLAAGGTGTNDNGNSFSVSGVGFAAARNIAYRNNTVKLTSGSNYAAARTGAIDAAEDLYGSCSDEVIQVKNAWYAVGVGNPGMPVFNSVNNATGICSGESFNVDLQSLRTSNLVTPDYSWSVNYNGLTGGSGTCLAACGSTISETLTNNTSSTITAVYTVTPTYDGCTGPSFTVNVPVYAVPEASNSSLNVLCSGYAFSIDLQSNITNGVASDFSWTVAYNGLTGGSGAGSGDYINESLHNDTDAGITAVYAVTPEGESGSCPGSSFDVMVYVPPQLHINAGDNQTVYYGYPPAECATLSWSDDGGGTPPYTYMWSTGETSQSIEVCPGLFTTEYYITITDANGCTFTDSVMVCVIDVRCGKKLDKVEICHLPPGNTNNNQSICVAVKAVATHLAHGDMLGACGIDHSCPPSKSAPVAETNDFPISELSVSPNPFTHSAEVTFTSASDGNVTLKLLDITGKLLSVLYQGNVEQGKKYEIEVDDQIAKPGLNFCVLQISDGTVLTQKIVLNK